MIFTHAKHHKTSNLRPVSPIGGYLKKLISNPVTDKELQSFF